MFPLYLDLQNQLRKKNGVAKAELTGFSHTFTAICVVADWWLTTTTCDSLISFEN